MSATDTRAGSRSSWLPSAVAVLVTIVLQAPAVTSAQEQAGNETADESADVTQFFSFFGGAAIGLLAHEAGHLAFDVAFDAEPRFTRVEFAKIPFFAITHRAGLPPRREYTIAAAGFWVQNGISEWVLSRRPHVRHERAPLTKGLLAWSATSAAAYAVAAFGRIGPPERDTRGMADAFGTSERWIGVMVLAPAVCDVWRYLDPDARWVRWVSRAAKVAMVVVVIGARD